MSQSKIGPSETDSEIRKFIRRAKSYVYKRGRHELADDFSQEAVIALITGRKATIPQLYVDFLRKEYGDLRSPHGRARSSSLLYGTSLDQPASEDDATLLHELVPSHGGDSGPVGIDWRHRVTFRGRDALIAELRYDEGMSEKDIADILGVTESRVCQIIGRRINPQIESAVLLAERLALFHDDPEASRLLVDWIKI